MAAFACDHQRRLDFSSNKGYPNCFDTQTTGRISLLKLLSSGQSFAEFSVDESLTTISGGDPRNSDPVFVPAVYYARPLRDDWRVGLVLNVPSGFGASKGPNWAGRYYSDQFSLVFLQTTASLAYPVTDWLSLGGGFSVIYSSSEDVTQVRNPGVDEPEAKLEGSASGFGVGWMASATIEFSPQTRLSVTYRR